MLRHFLELSDLIGIRLECRFIEDEEKLYQAIKSIFCLQRPDGYYYNDEFPNILLNLTDKQPQIQKNGFEIYRLDGIIIWESKHFSLWASAKISSKYVLGRNRA